MRETTFPTTVLFVLVAAAVPGCKDCPECPACPCADKAKGTAKADLGETDAGVAAAPMGGSPKPVTSFGLYARAAFDKVNVFEKPDMESTRLGYFRKGQRTMVGDPKYSSASCPDGWFQLREGGFVCQGRGMLVGEKPRHIPHPPPPPLLDSSEPYRHGFIRKDWTPLYKSVPSLDNLWKPPTREAPAGAQADAGAPAAAGPAEVLRHDESEADGGVDYYEYTKKKFRNVEALLSRRFWVSVASRRFDEATRKYYYETIRGDFVPGETVHLVNPPAFKGYEVHGDSPLPAVLVKDRHAAVYTERKGRFLGAGPVERLSVYRVLDKRPSGNAVFFRIDENRWVKSTDVEHFDLAEPPEGVQENEKWIRVDLARQTLEAYEGAMPVYVTLVSTGLAESEETVTPAGRFRILFKHVTDDMTGTVGDDEAYSVEDVPWVQYLHMNVALHGSFWHAGYGQPRSHGCINLAPADARWLFNWTTPALPPGWHAVAATAKNPGTLVVIQGKTPK